MNRQYPIVAASQRIMRIGLAIAPELFDLLKEPLLQDKTNLPDLVATIIAVQTLDLKNTLFPDQGIVQSTPGAALRQNRFILDPGHTTPLIADMLFVGPPLFFDDTAVRDFDDRR
jgi:hypothetical protein